MSYILTTISGDSSHLFQQVERLYLPAKTPPLSVADVTYGKGVFWKRINTTQYTFLPSDLMPKSPEVAKIDCRHLPYADDSLDVVVLDPPFLERGVPWYSDCYELKTFGITREELYIFYRVAMAEAKRVLQPGGLLVVKVKDDCAGGRQSRNSYQLWEYATRYLSMIDQDRFVLVRTYGPVMMPNRGTIQRHAVANESYLWIFKKR